MRTEKNISLIFTFYFLGFLPIMLDAQSVSNARFEQEGKTITIHYDLQGASGAESYTVEIYYKTDNSTAWQGPIRSATGAIGEGQQPGRGKTVSWGVLKDMEKLEGELVFEVRAKPENSLSGLGIKMATVTGGTFQMGSNDGESDEKPVHSVTLSSFEISKHEITNAQYILFLNDIGCNSNGSYGGTEYIDMDAGACAIGHNGSAFYFKGSGYAPTSDCPVIEVTWYGAKAFCEWAGGRLPTEAEWEFAARGGNSSNGYEYSGSNTIEDVAWYISNSGSKTHPVGTKSPNELGIYDMSGNVLEWCNDWYNSSYYSSSPQNNPQGPSLGSRRVLRGGGWRYIANICRVANRCNCSPDNSYHIIGFRLARSL